MSLEARETRRGYCNLSGRNDEDLTIAVMMEVGQEETDFKGYLDVKVDRTIWLR